VVAVVVTAAGMAQAGTAIGGRQAGTKAAPSRLLVRADEYSLMLSRRAIVRGTALIQLVNSGEDPHDLRLRRVRPGGRASRTFALPETLPAELRELQTRLSPGRYRLWCSLPGHRRQGMRAVLRVTRR
jgi:hypothetical protein